MESENLENLSAEELIDLSEKTIFGFMYERSKPYQLAREKFAEIGDDCGKENMQREVLAFDLMLNDSKRRFNSLVSGTTGTEEEWHYPDLDKQLPPETIEYYKQRVHQTENPVLKARYADLIWSIAKGHEYALIAVDAYLEAGRAYITCETGDWDHEVVESFERGMKLAWQLNLIDRLDESYMSVICALDSFVETGRFRYCDELIGLLLDCSSKLKNRLDLLYLRNITEKAIKHYEEDDEGYDLQEMFLELLVRLNQIGKDTDATIEAKRRLAETFVEQAEWMSRNGSGSMIASYSYEKALRLYMSLGTYQDRVEQLKVRIQECQRKARGEMVPISETIRIPIDLVERHLETYEVDNPKLFLAIMVHDRALIPSWDKTFQNSKLQFENLTLHKLGTTVVRGDLVIKNITDESEKLEYQAIQSMIRQYHLISHLLLTELFTRFKDRFGDHRKAIVSLLGESGAISADRIQILEVGVERFFAEDYVSACHIFVFQVEGILRDMVGKLGLPTYIYIQKSQEMRERTLSDLVAELGHHNVSPDLLKLISSFLNDIQGDNLRNNVAHGISTIDHFNRENAQLLLYILLRLSGYALNKSSQ